MREPGRCTKCGEELTEDERESYVRPGGDRLCADCEYEAEKEMDRRRDEQGRRL